MWRTIGLLTVCCGIFLGLLMTFAIAGIKS